MAENQKLKRQLGWLEVALFVGGVALLAVWFQVRGSAENQRADGIETLLAAAELRAEGQAGQGSESLFAAIDPPDQELWSDIRKAEYEASLETDADMPLAVLSIETLGIQVPVYNGADDFNLNRGVARIKGTGRVGDQGNLGIAGHRDGFFRALKDIGMGDTIQLQTINGLEKFRVSSIEIVDPDDVSVLAPTDSSSMTLVTCYPFYYVGHAPKRFIVKAIAEHLVVIN